MFSLVEFTDGVTLATITDNIDYALVSYQLMVAPLRDSELGGSGPYTDSIDAITFHTIGTTATAAYASAGTVNRLLDQARRWWKGEDVNPVKLRLQVQDSGQILEAVVKGRPSEETPNTALEVSWSANWCKYISEDITIKFVRRGQLLAPAVSTSAAGSVPATIFNVSFADQPADSPIKMSFSIAGVNPNTVAALTNTVLLIANTSTGIDILEMEFLTAAKFTSVADAGNKARSGNVLRYTPTDTLFAATATISSGVSSATKRIAIWLVLRSNTTAVTWTIRAVGTYAGTVNQVRTPDRTFVPTDTNPTFLFLGYLVSPFGFNNIGFEIKASTTAGAPTLDMDYRALLIGTSDSVRALTFDAAPGQGVVTTVLTVDPALLTSPQPLVSYGASGSPGQASYHGDVSLSIASAVPGSPTSVYFALLATSDNNWRLVDTAGNVVTITPTITRQSAYMVPQ